LLIRPGQEHNGSRSGVVKEFNLILRKFFLLIFFDFDSQELSIRENSYDVRNSASLIARASSEGSLRLVEDGRVRIPPGVDPLKDQEFHDRVLDVYLREFHF
jgi:hypothetical protein